MPVKALSHNLHYYVNDLNTEKIPAQQWFEPPATSSLGICNGSHTLTGMRFCLHSTILKHQWLLTVKGSLSSTLSHHGPAKKATPVKAESRNLHYGTAYPLKNFTLHVLYILVYIVWLYDAHACGLSCWINNISGSALWFSVVFCRYTKHSHCS